nr:hypothetical protein BaRGS_003838 [Batillaria attramentaria]
MFDNPCLEAALHLLDKAELGDSARRSPISVANSNDENGVLEGRWTEKYPKNTTVPWAWTGSVAILQQYMDKDKPVKYGQCWVFSGIITTLLRALGLPTRSVTNFESAHDTDASMTIDNHVDADGVMRCGPAPLKAIKEGHVWLNYDVPFVFSEVNGDRVYWKRNELGEMEVVDINPHAVGKKISTKAVGSNLRLDLTEAYKFPEGSSEERRVVRLVNRFSKYADENIYKKEVKTDVSFSLNIPEDVMIGDDVTVTLSVKNNSGEARPVRGRMTLMSGFYTGVPARRLDGEFYEFELGVDEEKKLEMTLKALEYQGKLNPEASLQLFVAFYISTTKQHYVTSKAFTLAKPTLDIMVPDDMKVGKEYQAVVTFTNPLSINLTNGAIHIEGASVASADVHEFKKPIGANETVTCNFNLKARRAGQREIEATFNSDQLSGVDGSVEFEVKRNIEAMDTSEPAATDDPKDK